MDKQRSTKHTHKTKDRVTRTPLKTGMNSGTREGQAVPAPHSGTVSVSKDNVQIAAESLVDHRLWGY